MDNQLEEIQKLYVQSKKYRIPKIPKEGEKQATVQITPLSMDELGLMNMNKDMPVDEMSKEIIKLMATSLGVEEKDTSSISIEYMKDIMDAIADANNFDQEEMENKGIKKFISEKQELIKSKETNDGSTE